MTRNILHGSPQTIQSLHQRLERLELTPAQALAITLTITLGQTLISVN